MIRVHIFPHHGSDESDEKGTGHEGNESHESHEGNESQEGDEGEQNRKGQTSTSQCVQWQEREDKQRFEEERFDQEQEWQNCFQEVLRRFEEALPGQPNPEVDESLCSCKEGAQNHRLRCLEQWSARQSTVRQGKSPVCQSLMAVCVMKLSPSNSMEGWMYCSEGGLMAGVSGT